MGASYGISLLDSPPFAPPHGPERFELLLPHLLLGMACVTAGNSALSLQHIPAGHPCGTARPSPLLRHKGKSPGWNVAAGTPGSTATCQPGHLLQNPNHSWELRDLHCGQAGFSIPNSFMNRAWLWMLQTPFLQHLGPQNFSHDLVGSLKENLKQHRAAEKLGFTGEAEIPVMRECTDRVPQLCTDTRPLIKSHKVWGAGMCSLPSHSGSEPLGQPGGTRGGIYLEEKALQVSQPLHPDWMHTETAADLIPTVCNLPFPQHTAGNSCLLLLAQLLSFLVFYKSLPLLLPLNSGNNIY